MEYVGVFLANKVSVCLALCTIVHAPVKLKLIVFLILLKVEILFIY